MRPKIAMFPVNSTNFSLISSGKKTKYYRNIVEIYTEEFQHLFGIELSKDFKLMKNGVEIEQTEAKGVKFCLSVGSINQPVVLSILAIVKLSIEYGDKRQGGNPNILYYTLTIEKVLK